MNLENALANLSHQLRQSVATSFITEIGLDDGGSTTEQKSINKQFQEFYKNVPVYESEAGDDNLITEFFDNSQMPSLDQDDVSSHEEPLTQAEIERAIKTSKSGKSPGPDGYPIEFYKAFSVKLVPLLCEVYEEALQNYICSSQKG